MKINTTVYVADKNGVKHKHHIRANSQKEYTKKVEELERRYQQAPGLKSVAEAFWEEHRHTINLNTQNGYIAPKKQICEYWENTPIDEIKPLDITRFLNELYEEFRYSKQTLKLRLIFLNMVMDYAVVHSYIENNPCSAVKLPNKAVSGKRELPLPSDIEKIKNGAYDSFGLYMNLLLYTGCRRCEALALEWSDIDFDHKCVKINKTILYNGDYPVLQNHTKSEAGNRTVPLLAPLEDILKKQKRKSGIIFNKDGNYLKRSQVLKGIRKFNDQHGIKLTVHQLRHEYATLLLNSGVNVKNAQYLLGHSSAEVTQDIYQHITEEQKNVAFVQIAEYLDTKMTPQTR